LANPGVEARCQREKPPGGSNAARHWNNPMGGIWFQTVQGLRADERSEAIFAMTAECDKSTRRANQFLVFRNHVKRPMQKYFCFH
jgi:hypothetical protein